MQMAAPNPGATKTPGPFFITGLYANGSTHAQICVYSRDLAGSPLPVWTWSPVTDETLSGREWDDLKASTSVTEVKWADGGNKAVALVGGYIVLLSTPNGGRQPRLEFATALQNAQNAHSVEVLPGNMIAVADNGHHPAGSGVQLYAIGDHRMGTGRYEQQVTGFPSTHGLLWDQKTGYLWVVGDSKWPTSEGAQGLVRAYAYDPATKRLNQKHAVQKEVGTGWRTVEAPDEWDGPHDITGIPDTREILITTEQDVYTWNVDDLAAGPVWAPQMTRFTTFSGDRHEHGYPRSRIKSIGMRAGSKEIIYTQPTSWGEDADYPDLIGFYEATQGGRGVKRPRRTAYKARWFEATPGWQSPPLRTPESI
ncbi:hypothetical protein OG535_40580 [Kitasatospora sp. NBC_00085]|uniref:hypothetical protein n=1 Tax=unclassified Kitasatospora TaxID=2633591 RepID=UPI003252F5BB